MTALIIGNVCGDGAGMSLVSPGSVTNSRFIDNVAPLSEDAPGVGGGLRIWVAQSTEVLGCEFRGNSADVAV